MAYIKGVSKYCDNWRDALNELQVMIESLKAENARLRARVPKWIPVSERLPEENVAVNITWMNHDPVFYYEDVKDKPFTATGVYFKGKWYWWSATVQDYLAEYGRAEWDEIEWDDVDEEAKGIEIVAWMPLPEPYEGGEADG